MDRGPGANDCSADADSRRGAGSLRAGARARRRRTVTIYTGAYVERSGERPGPGRHPRREARNSVSIPWAAPASTTGGRSPSVIGSISDVVNETSIPPFGFMTLDWDGKIRMDCSSPYAMARPDRAQGSLRRRVRLRHRPRPARDRHAAAPASCTRTTTLRSRSPISSHIGRNGGKRRGRRQDDRQQPDDRPGGRPARAKAREVPVGFKWFVDGLLDGSLGFGGRGERRRVIPPSRRHGVDHRQGRHHPGPCSRRR